MAKIGMEINIDETVDPAVLQQWFVLGASLDRSVVSKTVTADGLSLTRTGSREYVEGVDPGLSDEFTRHERVPPREIADAEEQPTDDDQQSGQSAELTNGTAPKRTGRKTNAQKAAEREAAEQAAAGTSPAVQPAAQPSSFPPGITMPGTAAVVQPPQNVASPSLPPAAVVQPPQNVASPSLPPAAAMPHVPAADPARANGVMSLEEFRAAMLANQKAYPSKPNLFLRRTTWLDGTAKPSWYTVPAIPDEFRERVLSEVGEWCESGYP